MLSHEERRQVIRDYAEEYHLRIMVESGTNDGGTPAAVLDSFDEIITIEIDPVLFSGCAQRFTNSSKVHCLLGDSGVLLVNIVRMLHEPTLFWLDGHFCGGDFKPDIDTPIKTELHSVIHAPKGSVILIDDARLFGGMAEHTEEFKDYPDVSWIMDFVQAHGLCFTVKDDIIRVTP